MRLPEPPPGYRPVYRVGARRRDGGGWEMRIYNFGAVCCPTLDEADRVVRAYIAQHGRWPADGFDIVISVSSSGAPEVPGPGRVPQLGPVRALLAPHADLDAFDWSIDAAIEELFETGSPWRLRHELETWLYAGLGAAFPDELLSGKDIDQRSVALRARAAQWLAEQPDSREAYRALTRRLQERRRPGAQS